MDGLTKNLATQMASVTNRPRRIQISPPPAFPCPQGQRSHSESLDALCLPGKPPQFGKLSCLFGPKECNAVLCLITASIEAGNCQSRFQSG